MAGLSSANGRKERRDKHPSFPASQVEEPDPCLVLSPHPHPPELPSRDQLSTGVFCSWTCPLLSSFPGHPLSPTGASADEPPGQPLALRSPSQGVLLGKPNLRHSQGKHRRNGPTPGRVAGEPLSLPLSLQPVTRTPGCRRRGCIGITLVVSRAGLQWSGSQPGHDLGAPAPPPPAPGALWQYLEPFLVLATEGEGHGHAVDSTGDAAERSARAGPAQHVSITPRLGTPGTVHGTRARRPGCGYLPRL